MGQPKQRCATELSGNGTTPQHEVKIHLWSVRPNAVSLHDDLTEYRTARSASSPHGSAQIRGAVSVHQGSLIRKASRYVRRACMWVVCCSNCTWMWSSTVRTTQSHRAQQFAAVKAIASGLRAVRS
jgi:hypothetical protein